MQTETPARRCDQKSPQGSGDSGDGWTQSSSPTEVYDIGADSEDDIGHISSAVRALDVEGDYAPWHERSPCSSRKGAKYDVSTAASSCNAAEGLTASSKAEDQADAWNVEDWDSHLAQLREVATPCRASPNAKLKVADTVRAELQADVELLVQEAMDEMRSWLSQEIAFARRNLEEVHADKPQPQANDEVELLKQRVEEQGLTLEKLKEGNDLEKLRKDLQDQARIIRKLDDAASSTDARSSTTSSERVLEARAVAEERKWRLRLETFESSVARSVEQLESCNQRILELQERTAANEADLQRGLCSSQSAERQCAETTKDVGLLRVSADKQAEDMKQLERQVRRLTAELAAAQDASNVAVKLANGQKDLVGALEETSRELASTQRQQKEEMLSFGTRLQEVLAGVAACKTETMAAQSRMDAVAQQTEDTYKQVFKSAHQMSMNEERLHDATEEMRAQSQQLESVQPRLKIHEDSLRLLEDQYSQQESKFSSMHLAVGRRMEKLEREVSTTETELSTMQSCLEEHNAHLCSLDKQRLSLAAKAALQEEHIQKMWAAVEGLENQVHSDHKELFQVSRYAKEQGQGLEDLRTEVQAQSKAALALDGKLGALQCESTRVLDESREQVKSALSERQAEDSEKLQKICLEIESLKTDSQERSKVQAAVMDRQEVQDAQNSRYDGILENLLQQNTSLLDQAFVWDADIKCVMQRVGMLEDKAEYAGSELDGLRQSVAGFTNQLQEEVESMQRSQSSTSEVATWLQREMSTQVSRTEMQQMHSELQDWVTATRQEMDRWLSSSLDKFQKEQGLVLQNHQGWMHRVKRWVEKIHIREQGLSHVILHILQEGSPDMVKLLEEALKMPRKPATSPGCE